MTATTHGRTDDRIWIEPVPQPTPHRVMIEGTEVFRGTFAECYEEARRLDNLARGAELELARQELEELGPCKWFLGCTNTATTRTVHPAFPDGVPTCPRCAYFAEHGEFPKEG